MLNKVLPVKSGKYLDKLLQKPQFFYIGFDPTTPSLHLGHLSLLIASNYLMNEGHKSIFIIGEHTASIGDYSDRDGARRKNISQKEIADNSSSIKNQIQKIMKNLNQASSQYMIESNKTANDSRNALNKCFNNLKINDLLELRKAESNLSQFTVNEFLYPCYQANDWLNLYSNYGCLIQLAGVDQSGNVTIGQKLIKSSTGLHSFGILFDLLNDEKDQKLSKSSESAIFLNDAPFLLYQKLLNISDKLATEYVHKSTTFNVAEISEICDSHANYFVQKQIARNVIEIVYGGEFCEDVELISKALFEDRVFDFNSFDAVLQEKMILCMPTIYYRPNESRELTGEYLNEIVCNELKYKILPSTIKITLNGDTIKSPFRHDSKTYLLKFGKKNFRILKPFEST